MDNIKITTIIVARVAMLLVHIVKDLRTMSVLHVYKIIFTCQMIEPVYSIAQIHFSEIYQLESANPVINLVYLAQMEQIFVTVVLECII